jgi:hypothetical protein
MTSLRRWSLAVLVLSTVLARPALAADRADKREIIRDARAAYYSLRQKGLDSFQVNITVNWNVVLKGKTSNAEQMRLLNGLHFQMGLDAKGATKVSHRADVPAPNEQSQRGYDQIFTGIDQTLNGFFATYSPFMVTSPFPAVNGAYTLEDSSNGYRLTYEEDNGKTDVVTRFTKTLAIIDMTVDTAEFLSVITPTFLTTADGFVLAGYRGTYKPKQSRTGVVILEATIEHRVVDGLRLPSRLSLDSSLDDVPNQTELTFADYFINKR